MGIFSDLHTQLVFTPPTPTTSFSHKTIIITGANVGLGKEAAKHFVRLGAEKVICAVRSLPKGKAAKTEIEAQTQRTGVVDIYELDLASYASIQNFGAKVAQLPRVDVVVLNAGVATEEFEMFEDNESTITVNVMSTTLLALLMLPILRTSATKFGIEPVITIVGSGIHMFTSFPERKTPNSLATLNNKETANMKDRWGSPALFHLYIQPNLLLPSARINN